MRNTFTTLFLFILINSMPACAILVDAVDDAESKATAAMYPFMGYASGWDEEGGTRYSAGSCFIVRNNESDGAWVLTAGHTVDHLATHETYAILRYCFESCYFDAFPKDTNGYTDKAIVAFHDKVFYHEQLDVALVKLEHLVYDTTGELVAPVEFYSGTLSLNQVILFGGSGDTGIPSQASLEGTGYRDGYRRCARGIFRFISSTYGVMKFDRSVDIPGIASMGDSGGFAAIEASGNILVCGILVGGTSSGESMKTRFECLAYDANFSAWMENIISENGEQQSSVKSWAVYE